MKGLHTITPTILEDLLVWAMYASSVGTYYFRVNDHQRLQYRMAETGGTGIWYIVNPRQILEGRRTLEMRGIVEGTTQWDHLREKSLQYFVPYDPSQPAREA
jgi:hypothetical protein